MVQLQDVSRTELEQFDHRLKDVPALVAVGPKHAGQHRVRLRTFLGPVPRRQLPRDHRRATLALGQVVRGVHKVVVQEPQDALPVLAQQLGQPGVVRVGVRPRQQPVPALGAPEGED